MPNQTNEPAKLNDLLHWAVQNTNTSPNTSITTHPNDRESNSEDTSAPVQPTAPKKLDTAVLDAILGRSNAVQMREAIEVFENVDLDLQTRISAGESLEELVEDLDNANDLEVLGIWPKLIQLLKETNETINFYACWISGTAVQNNPKSQLAFLKHDPIPILLNLLNTSTDPETQSKSLYCLSSTLKHVPNPTAALRTFTDHLGWQTLDSCLKGPSMNLRRKTVFLINSLAMQSDENPTILSELRSHSILNTLTSSVSPSRGIPTGLDGELLPQDDDYTEKALRAMTTIILTIGAGKSQAQDTLSEDEKSRVREMVAELGDQQIRDHRLEGAGVAESEWNEVLRKVGL